MSSQPDSIDIAKAVAAMTDEQKGRFLDALVPGRDLATGIPLEEALASLDEAPE